MGLASVREPPAAIGAMAGIASFGGIAREGIVEKVGEGTSDKQEGAKGVSSPYTIARSGSCNTATRNF